MTRIFKTRRLQSGSQVLGLFINISHSTGVGLIHIRDSVHNYISFEEETIIGPLVDTHEFQRLRGIRQLGVGNMVYPGAEHSRFSHSLGVAHLSGRMYDFLAGEQANPDDREKVMIAGLLHDIGHTPLSHMFEHFFTRDTGHEEWGRRIIQDGETGINEILSKSKFDVTEIANLLVRQPSKPRFLHMIVSSQLDADRFDYLLRDAHHTGAPEGRYDLERILRIISLDEEERIQVREKGKHSVEGYLTSRYHMYNQVYLHPTTICFEFLLQSIVARAADLTASGKDPGGHVFNELPLSLNADPGVNEFLTASDWSLFGALRIWWKSEDRILKDLCDRFFSRSRSFKPVKRVKLEIVNLWGREEQLQGILHSHNLDPQYYVHLATDKVKEAYKPYGPQREDQENAIFLDTGMEITEAFPNLRSLIIGPHPFIIVPEECREEVEGLLL